MKRNISIVVLTQNKEGKVTAHTKHTTVEGEDVTDLSVYEKIEGFLDSVRDYAADEERIISLSHSIFA